MRVLALDLGDRRIGVAVSDALGMVARPLEILLRRSRTEDFSHLKGVSDAHGVELIVIGLPLNMDGTEGRQAAWVRDYATGLSEAIGRPVAFWDERLSTEEAKDVVRAQGKTPARGSLDAIAAAVILQSYLDAHSALGAGPTSGAQPEPGQDPRRSRSQ